MTQGMKIVGFDPLGNAVLQGCIFDWCKFPPGPFHKHSLILQEDMDKVPAEVWGEWTRSLGIIKL